MSVKSAAGFQISVSGMGLSCLQKIKALLKRQDGGSLVADSRIDFDPIVLVVTFYHFVEDAQDAMDVVVAAAQEVLNREAFDTFMKNVEVVEPHANA